MTYTALVAFFWETMALVPRTKVQVLVAARALIVIMIYVILF